MASDEYASALVPFGPPSRAKDHVRCPHRLRRHSVPGADLADRGQPVAVNECAGFDLGLDVVDDALVVRHARHPCLPIERSWYARCVAADTQGFTDAQLAAGPGAADGDGELVQ